MVHMLMPVQIWDTILNKKAIDYNANFVVSGTTWIKKLPQKGHELEVLMEGGGGGGHKPNVLRESVIGGNIT